MPANSEDTVRTLLRRSKGTLSEVSAIIERGRITRSERKVQVQGPWVIGNLYSCEAFEIKLYIANSTTTEACPSVQLYSNAVYIGLSGRAQVFIASTGTMRLEKSTTAFVGMGVNHVLEPVQDSTEVALILLGHR